MKFNKCLIVLLVLAIFLSINLACASDVNSTDVSHVGADDAISVNDVSYSNLDSSSFNNVNSVYDFENAMNEAHCAHVKYNNHISVYNNHASSGAGVYMSNKATMRATKSEFECNWADKDGGAVYANDRCMCFVDNSSISFNKAASGPETYIDNSSFLKIDNCMREGNGSIDGNNLNLSNGSKCYLDGKYF